VQSGPYPVSEVRGRVPAGVEDFVGVSSFAVIKDGLSYRVFGTGDLTGGVVRFQQQDLGWDGRNIRMWTITATAAGVVAEPDTAT
jgi:hypothetical protein